MMTPQELMDLPGYGKAIPHLIKQKQWDEYAGLEYREFAVDLSATVTVEDTIIVKARHEDEAEEKAVNEFASTHDCYEEDVETVEVRDSKGETK